VDNGELKSAVTLSAVNVRHATQGFKVQRTQEVANYMAGICHVVWLASN